MNFIMIGLLLREVTVLDRLCVRFNMYHVIKKLRCTTLFRKISCMRTVSISCSIYCGRKSASGSKSSVRTPLCQSRVWMWRTDILTTRIMRTLTPRQLNGFPAMHWTLLCPTVFVRNDNAVYSAPAPRLQLSTFYSIKSTSTHGQTRNCIFSSSSSP